MDELKGFLRLPEVLKIFPIAKSTWWKGVQLGRYPAPIKLSPSITVWKAEDISNLVKTIIKKEVQASFQGNNVSKKLKGEE